MIVIVVSTNVFVYSSCINLVRIKHYFFLILKELKQLHDNIYTYKYIVYFNCRQATKTEKID